MRSWKWNCGLVICAILLCFSPLMHADELKIAIFGLGGRAQELLVECLQLKEETGKAVRVVAVCDDNAQNSYQFFVQNTLAADLLDDYSQLFQTAEFYPDDEKGIEKLLKAHPDLDRIWITSFNHRHQVHLHAALNSNCKTIYLEKPLFKTLEEFHQFDSNVQEKTIQVGLTLRYALITKTVVENLKKYHSQLGKLQAIHSWEHVHFGHGLSIIMMNWRRQQSLSGGFLLDKSVHDLDLAFYFMQALDVHPQTISMCTKTDHDFYKKSNHPLILNQLLTNRTLQQNVEKWNLLSWQRKIPFIYDFEGKIDWEKTMANFFSDFPDGDDFSTSDLIADSYEIFSKIQTRAGDTIDFHFDVKLNGFATESKRGSLFSFENGEVEVDIENSKLCIRMKSEDPIALHLNISGRHAGGDVYVAHTILGTLPEDHPFAKFSDPSVQLSTLMALISEYQALDHLEEEMHMVQTNDRWNLSLKEVD